MRCTVKAGSVRVRAGEAHRLLELLCPVFLRAVGAQVVTRRKRFQSVRLAVTDADREQAGAPACRVDARHILEGEALPLCGRDAVVKVTEVIPENVERRRFQHVRKQNGARGKGLRVARGPALHGAQVLFIAFPGEPDFLLAVLQLGDFPVRLFFSLGEKIDDAPQVVVVEHIPDLLQREVHLVQRVDRVQAHDVLAGIAPVFPAALPALCVHEPDAVVMPQRLARHIHDFGGFTDRKKIFHKVQISS